MASTLVGPNRKTKPKKMPNPKQMEFCEIYLSNGMNGAAAARAAGYAPKNAPLLALRLLKNKTVNDYLSWRKTQLYEEFGMQQYELLSIMRRVLKCNMMKMGRRSNDGFIEIDAEEWDRVADEIGDLVMEVEQKVLSKKWTEEDDEGNPVQYEESKPVIRLKLMSKDKMFELAVKMAGMDAGDGQTVNIGSINFLDNLCDSASGGEDIIEGRIEGS